VGEDRGIDEPPLRAVTESINDAVISADAQSRIVFWNAAAERIFGWTQAEALGRPLTELMAPEYRERHLAGVARLRRTGEPRVLGHQAVRLQGLRRDGSVFPLELSLGSWKTEERTMYTGIVRDISDRVAGEVAVRRLAAIIEGSDDAILSVAGDATILSWNPGAEKLYGYSESEIVGRPLGALVPPDRAGEEHEIVERVLGGEILVHYETERVTKDGRRTPVALTVSPIRNGDRIVAVSLIGRDISQRKRVEAALRRSNADLEHFATLASHDLAAPANAIRGLAELAQSRYGDAIGEEGRALIAAIRESATGMQALVDDLLAFARLDAVDASTERVELDEVLRLALESLRPQITTTAARITHDPLPAVLASRSQLVQVMQNLLANAIKFRSTEPPRVHVASVAGPEGIRVAVTDNGRGLPPGAEERIFEMFTQAHEGETEGGTGIGLAIAKRIVERHGGRIWAERPPAGGVRFCFVLRPA
jgi:PAS domain S-box-containing protein